MRHRDVQRGTLRAAVFGVSDGLTTNVALILGVAAAARAAPFVRLAGSRARARWLRGVPVDAAQAELLEYELRREADELWARPDYEQQELAAIYRRRGLPHDLAETVAAALMREPAQALETHAREELGIRPDRLGSPVGAAGSSFGSFVGALLPLLPWFWLRGSAAILASVLVGAVAALAVGAAVGYATGRPPLRAAARQLALTAAAAGVTVLVGHAVGISGA